MKKLLLVIVSLLLLIGTAWGETDYVKYRIMQLNYINIFTNDDYARRSIKYYSPDETAPLMGYAQALGETMAGYFGSAEVMAKHVNQKFKNAKDANYSTFSITLNTVFGQLDVMQIRKFYALLDSGWKVNNDLAPGQLSAVMLVNAKNDIQTPNSFWIIKNTKETDVIKSQHFKTFITSLFIGDAKGAIKAINSVKSSDIEKSIKFAEGMKPEFIEKPIVQKN